MAGNKGQGPIGVPTNNPVLDAGTLCRQVSPLPSALGTPTQAQFSVSLTRPALVGKAKREPGFNFDGTPAEDMMFGDQPAKSASIRKDPVFQLNDATLNAYMKQLMTSLSIGKMETVALQMQAKFAQGKGGTYRSDVLDAEIANHSAFVNYHSDFAARLRAALQKCQFDASRVKIIPMDLLHFSSFWDKVSGLGITIHQVWSAKAELHGYILNCSTGFWHAYLVYTFYDHFGLDWEDILKHGEDRIPQYHTGDFFKAWYILQHYRSARPFITEMKRRLFVAGKVA